MSRVKLVFLRFGLFGRNGGESSIMVDKYNGADIKNLKLGAIVLVKIYRKVGFLRWTVWRP